MLPSHRELFSSASPTKISLDGVWNTTAVCNIASRTYIMEVIICHKENQNLNCFVKKSILSILDGDVDFGTLEVNGTDSGIKISMPHLSGPTLCDISNKFGLSATYR